MFKEDFVVGKIYTPDNNSTRCYYVGPNLIDRYQGIFQDIFNNTIYSFLYESSAYEWKEYREPRKGTRWMNVYSYSDGGIFTRTYETREQANRHLYSSATRIACVEVPWVEGQGL